MFRQLSDQRFQIEAKAVIHCSRSRLDPRAWNRTLHAADLLEWHQLSRLNTPYRGKCHHIATLPVEECLHTCSANSHRIFNILKGAVCDRCAPEKPRCLATTAHLQLARHHFRKMMRDSSS